MSLNDIRVRDLPIYQEPLQVLEILKRQFQRPQSQMRAAKKNAIVSGALKGVGQAIKSRKLPPARDLDAAGTRLAQALGGDALQLASALQNDPWDLNARTQLILQFSSSPLKSNLAALTDALLLAHANNLDPVQLKQSSLYLASHLQSLLLVTLHDALREDEARLAEEESTDERTQKQLKELRNSRSYVGELAKLLKAKGGNGPLAFKYKEVALGGKPTPKQQQDLNTLLRLLVGLPLLRDQQGTLLEALRKADPNSLLLNFYEAESRRMEVFTLQLQNRFLKKPELTQKTSQLLQEALLFAQKNVDNLGVNPQPGFETNCLLQLATLCSQAIVQVRRSRESVSDSLATLSNRTLETLRKRSDDPKVAKAINQLVRATEL